MYACRCPPGVHGMNCDTVVYATFGGNKGLLVEPPAVTSKTTTVVTFNFQTTVDTELILYLSRVCVDSNKSNLKMSA